jgi:hypothetical protein
MQSSDCTMGDVCVNGQCVAPSNTCQFNDQCGTGRVCVNSQCRQQCGMSGQAPCPTGTQCLMSGGVSYCGDVTATGCVHDTDCGAGNVCVNGTCLQSCTPSGANTCGTGFYCADNGTCVVDTRPHPLCDAAHPCAAGSACVGGVCRIPCTTSMQCAMVDVTYRNCGMLPGQAGTQNYCLTDNEARPTCSLQSMCSAGQSCVDGQCR